MLALAVHLGRSGRARALYLLTMATFDGDWSESDRIETLHALIQDALELPQLTRRPAANEVEQRKLEAKSRTDDPDVKERIARAA